ncbi:hypothetical protein RhiirA1_507803 [Rhizophagus irregularis]|uniref:MULE transposase domain-containing protein n=1 Tax=Rhizophagus irregularis TaxID=588596 RepID=A0A2N0QSU3_9GLOM|nr:hypothetical protein RhiirA1_507803 [Rhizophagus irregularis]
MGEEYVKEIEAGKRKDRLCWSWTMYCAGGNSCQRECGNIGSCKENCANRNFPNNIKNSHDMHLCKVRVISESKLSWLKTSKPLRIKIIGSHLPANALNTHIPNSSKLNLTREIRDKIILNRRSDYKTVKEIKMTLLAPYNGANEETLRNVLNEQREICNDTKLRGFIKRDDRRLKENSGSWTILHYLVTEILKLKGYVLYYQQPDPLAPEDHPDHYYQLTLSNDLWLKNGQKFGNFCIGLDGKYDLNNDHAPILTMIVENNTGCATPLAFSLSNKENNWTIRLAIQAIKQNIPVVVVNVTMNGITKIYHPERAIIDKHRPSRIAIQSLLRGSILCWFHIMKTIGENFSQWNIPWSIRYPLAIAFKIVGRSRSVKQCEELAIEYKKFINSLDLANNVKQKIIKDIYNNWISDEWILGFIDAERLPQTLQDNPMTTNNFTERMNRSIETNHSGIKTVVNFVERLYGLKLNRENITERSGETSFEAGLSTLFDAQSIEQENQSKHISSDKLRRLNLGRLYFLMGYVKSSNNNNYFYVKKHNQLNVLESSYDGSFVKMDDNIIEKLYPLYQKFAKNHYSVVPELEGYYLTNIFSGECLICLDYIWNGSFRDVCKYCHAAKIYKESLNAENLFDYSQEVKNQLVTYFKNKERVISAENKNKLIYEGDTHVAYNEILRLFELQGTKIFWSDNKPLKLNRDPFRPELNNKRDFNAIGAPPKPSAKPRKPSRILCNSILEEDKENKETFSTQQRKTKRTRRQIRTYKENAKDNGITRIMKIIWDHLYLMLIYLLRTTSILI